MTRSYMRLPATLQLGRGALGIVSFGSVFVEKLGIM